MKKLMIVLIGATSLGAIILQAGGVERIRRYPGPSKRITTGKPHFLLTWAPGN